MDKAQGHYGVLLLNMGGPDNLDEVEDYIYQLLADPDMIRMPLAGLLQKPFARMVARRRSPKVRQRYGMIGGKSPIHAETTAQAALLSEVLKLPVGFAMRYTAPTADTAVAGLLRQGVARLVVIPLYPQYSGVSTLSAIKDFTARVGGRIDYRIIDRHFHDAGYIDAMSKALSAVLEQAEPGMKTHLLFAAHSIPEAYIRRGDPYAGEVEQTMALICRALAAEYPHSLAYQSRVGPVKWRGPTLDEELAKLVANGVEQIIVQPLSFVSENLETLFDLDIDFRESCQAAGIKSLLRVPTLSASPHYASALAGLARGVIDDWEGADA